MFYLYKFNISCCHAIYESLRRAPRLDESIVQEVPRRMGQTERRTNRHQTDANMLSAINADSV